MSEHWVRAGELLNRKPNGSRQWVKVVPAAEADRLREALDRAIVGLRDAAYGPERADEIARRHLAEMGLPDEYLAAWEQGADEVWYCRECRHEVGSGHEPECSVAELEKAWSARS